VISNQTVFAVTSLCPDQATPAELLSLWQSHWRIESLFWIRDAAFGEDHSTTRTSHAHQVLAALRNLVISLIHLWRGRHITATGSPEVSRQVKGSWQLAHTNACRGACGIGTVN
jgi:hypothetical protein